MKLLPVVFAASSIACGLTQSLALSVQPEADGVCPATCGFPERELLNLVMEHYPKVLPELESNLAVLSSGIPINDVLKAMNKPAEHTDNSGDENPDGLPNVNTPYVRVVDPKYVVEAIKGILPDNLSSTIDNLISQKPKTLDSAMEIVSSKLGHTYAHTDLDTSINTKNLVRELRTLKKSGAEMDLLTLLSTFLKHLEPLLSDKHRFFRIFKFFRNASRSDSKLQKLFTQLIPSEHIPNVTNMPFNELIARIIKNNPKTPLEDIMSHGDCGCFDFVDTTMEMSKVEIPETRPVMNALLSLQEQIPSATIQKLISDKPETIGDALRLLSKSLGSAFDATGLNISINTKRFIADVRQAAQKRGGNLDRFTLVGYTLKHQQSTDAVSMFRVIKFFRNIVKQNPTTKMLFSRFIPTSETGNIPSWTSKQLIKEIIKFNPGSDITRTFTGKKPEKVPEPKGRNPTGRKSNGGPKIGIPKIGGIGGAIPKIGVPKTSLPKIDAPKGGLPMPKIGIPKTELPKVGGTGGAIPKIDLPDLSKIPEPKVGIPKATGTGSKVDVPSKTTKPIAPKIGVPIDAINGKAGSIGADDYYTEVYTEVY